MDDLFRIELKTGDIVATVNRTLPTYARGSALLAVLAIPPEKAEDRFTRELWRAYGRIVLAVGEQDVPGWGEGPQQVIPSHLAMDLGHAQKLCAGAKRKLDDRLGAAHCAAPHFQYAERQATANHGTGQPRHGKPGIAASALRVIEQEAERVEVLPEHGVTVPARFPAIAGNFETRVLRPSRPVLHLAFAMAQAIERSARELASMPREVRETYRRDVNGRDGTIREQIDMGDVLVGPYLQDWIVAQAERLEDLLPFMPTKQDSRSGRSPVVRVRFI
jgi:hypothetical protein